ncbi:MAG: TonB family protein [Verrucomicrobiota bacterium JB022]|nr:TonB family protein [Verrucomicrobiota bacterium JB022]
MDPLPLGLVSDQTDSQLAFALVGDSPALCYKALYRSPKNREDWDKLLPGFLPAPDELNLRYFLASKATVTRFRLEPPSSWKQDRAAVWPDLREAGVRPETHLLGLFQATTGEAYAGEGPALAIAVPRNEVRQIGRLLDNSEVSLDRRHVLAALPANLSYLIPIARAQDHGGPVALVELHDDRCDLWIMSGRGLRLHRQTSTGLNSLVARLQQELNLKFPGSAAKLVYEGLYDFSASAEALTQEIGQRLRQDLNATEEIIGEPVRALAFSSLPPSADWMTEAIGAHAERAVLRWPAPQGGAQPENESEKVPQTLLAPAVAGALARIERPSETAWQWYLEDEECPFLVPSDVAAADTPKGMTRATFVSIAGSQAEAEEPTMDPEEDFEVGEEAPAPAAKAPEPVKPTPAPVAAKPAPTPAPTPEPVPERKKGSPLPLIAAIIALLLIGGGIFFAMGQGKSAEPTAKVVQAPQKTPEQLAQEAEAKRQAEEEAQRQAEEEARRQAEEEAKRKAEEEARIAAEAAALAEKIVAAEAAREKEHAAMEQEARMARQGKLNISGLPEGTVIKLNGKEVGQTSLSDYAVDPGTYYVAFEHPDYEPLVREINVQPRGSQRINDVELAASTGHVKVSAQPLGSHFAIFRAGADEPVREGTTPAEFDLPVGTYHVSFSRNGWEDRSESLVVGRNNHTEIATQFPVASIALNTVPSGANVSIGGIKVGTTPYSNPTVAPGIYQYHIHRPGYESVDFDIAVRAGEQFAHELELNDLSRVFRANEIDVMPIPLYQPEPDIGDVRKTEEVVVEFVIDPEGQPTDIQIVRTSNERLNKAVLKAVDEWRFQPAMRRENAVRLKVRLPLVFSSERNAS